MMGMSPGNQAGGPAMQSSPLGAASSPLHSTPQSPLMSPSPSMQPSPLMQHSPMASPLTPSPGPAAGSLAQTSPRGQINPGVHMIEDPQFSSSNDVRLVGQNPVGGRVHQMSHLRMSSPGAPSHSNLMSQTGGLNPINPGVSGGMTLSRGINPNMVPMQQHRPLMENQIQRPRPGIGQEHIR